jgi:hypothetical protein
MSELITEACEFWMVWTKTGHKPRHMHQTEASAIAEAERLASLKPHGKKFIVLRGYRKCHVPAETAAPSLASCSTPLLAEAASVHQATA